MDARKRRRESGSMKFAEGNGLRKGRNFFVEPNTSDMVKRLACGDYIVLVGARQTGKTVTAFCAMDELREKGYKCIYIDFPAQCCHATSLREFWETMAWCLYSAAPGFLPKPATSGTFCEGFVGSMLRDAEGCEDVIIVFDEANHFSRLNTEFKCSFLSILKQNRDCRLLSLMMVGTEALLEDLNISNKYTKVMGMQVSNVYSPFSGDAVFFSSHFTEEEIRVLLSEYSRFSGVHVHNEIAAHIFKLTRGRKGLVGVCCGLLAYDKSMVDFGHRSYSMWRRFVRSSLTENVFSRATYNNIYQNCYVLGDKDWILLEMLREGGTATIPLAGDRAVATAVKFLVVEGIAVDSSSSDDQANLTFSSPLLQSRLLKQLCVKNELPVAVPLGPLPFDRLWVIRRTVEQLDPEVFLRPESKYTSEYSLQLECFLKIKKVLSSTYPLLDWLAIPEADDSANLDILIRDGDRERWFAFELLQQGNLASMADHYDRAVWYAGVHGCQVYMLNFVLDGILLPEVESFKYEEAGPVIVYNIVLNENTARLVGGHAGDGTFEDTELKLQRTGAQLSLVREVWRRTVGIKI